MSDQEKQQHGQLDGAEHAAQSGPPPEPLRSPSAGAVLSAARQARGWSVEYVASHLKLAIRQIHALEEDHYAALPGVVVTRGFIRIYAKMLDIDPVPLVAQLPVDSATTGHGPAPARTLSTPFSESSLPLRGRHELPVTALVWLGVGIIVVAGLFAASKYGVWDMARNSLLGQRLHLATDAAVVSSEADASGEAGNKPPVVADSDNAVLQGTTAADDAASGAAPATASPAVPAAASVAAPAPAAANPVAIADTGKRNVVADTAKQTAAAATASVAPATAATATAATTTAPAAAPVSPLQLTVRQDSWVEIRRNSDKRTMISRVLKAGSNETFDINEPVTLIVGNVAGVEATLRGQALDLGLSNGNNVARLNLK